MSKYNGYEIVSVGDIPQTKLTKAIKTGKLSLAASDLKGNRKMLLHPTNAKLVRAAKAKNKGVTGMGISGGEINNDLVWHDSMGGGINGGSLWSFLKNAGKTVYKFAKDNWSLLKPIASKVADAALPAFAAAVGEPAAAAPGRALLKDLTGVGIKDQRLANLAKARAAKAAKKQVYGGSFRLN